MGCESRLRNEVQSLPTFGQKSPGFWAKIWRLCSPHCTPLEVALGKKKAPPWGVWALRDSDPLTFITPRWGSGEEKG
ncbi:MAG: hypothetical protein Kow0070_27210 [Anaerolineales bacterium]